MKHTEGTLEYEAATNTIRAKPSNYWVASMDSWDGAVDNVVNAQRLCACWNACEGINPEAVKDLLKACQLAAKEIYHLMSELGDDPNEVGCYSRLQQAIAKAAK